MKTALAALMGIVALGGFAVRQWLKYQHQTLKYHMELAENMYFRNINNNAGIFEPKPFVDIRHQIPPAERLGLGPGSVGGGDRHRLRQGRPGAARPA